MKTDINDLFEKCVNRVGSCEISCKLGLWGVYGPGKEAVESEARRYWAKYYEDGEYDSLLSKSLSDGGKG